MTGDIFISKRGEGGIHLFRMGDIERVRKLWLSIGWGDAMSNSNSDIKTGKGLLNACYSLLSFGVILRHPLPIPKPKYSNLSPCPFQQEDLILFKFIAFIASISACNQFSLYQYLCINLLSMTSQERLGKNQSMNSTHHMSCNQSYATNICSDGRPNTSVLLNYSHIPMAKEHPHWNQSSATWRHTSHKYSFSRQNRFKDNPFYYSDIIEPQIPSTLADKSCTFGKGTRRPISNVVLRNAKEKPAPDRYDMSITDEQPRRKSKGKTFGLGWRVYEKNFIKHRSDAYAEFHTENNPAAKYEVRQIPGDNKHKYTAYGRLKMYSDKMAEDKSWVPGPCHEVKDRHLYGMTGLNDRNFAFGERIDFTKPANDNPEAIYEIPGFCDVFSNLKHKKEKASTGR